MATTAAGAKTTTEGTPRPIGELDRLVDGELAVMKVRTRDCWIRVGGYLSEMKPQLKGKFLQHVRTRFGFSPSSASDYMKMYLADRAGRRVERPSDVRGGSRADHYPKGYGTWRAAQGSAGAAHSERPGSEARRNTDERRDQDVLEAAAAIVTAGYRDEVRRTHPDAGGSGSSGRMASLGSARTLLVTLLRSDCATRLLRRV